MDEVESESDAAFLFQNVDKICRVCLVLNQSNQSIFHTSNNDLRNKNDTDLVKKLFIQGGIEILENDGLPSKICLTCILKVNAAHEFREQCRIADEKLRKLYGKPQKNIISSNKIHQFSQTENEFLSFVKDEKKEMEKPKPPKHDLPQNCPEYSIEIKNDHEMADITDPSNGNESFSSKEKNMSDGERERCKTKEMTESTGNLSADNVKNMKEKQRRRQYTRKVNSAKPEPEETKSFTRKRIRRGMDKKSIKTVYELNYECNICQNTYSTKKSLDRHISIHKSNKKSKCEYCDKVFLKLDELAAHIQSSHIKEEGKSKSIRCRICEKNFRKLEAMVRHLNVHKKANPSEVFLILKEIRNNRKIMESSLRDVSRDESHTKEQIPSSAVDSLQLKPENQIETLESESGLAYCADKRSFSLPCQQCGESYSSENSSQRQAQTMMTMTTHSEEKFTCNVCNMKFSQDDRFSNNRDRYEDKTDEIFREPENPPDGKSAIKLINAWIREELDSDNEGKGFHCDVCGKSYVTRKSLSKHLTNVHASPNKICTTCNTRECVCDKKKNVVPAVTRVYSCDECGKSFEKESKLKKHLQIHERAREQQNSNFKRFLCHICSKTFRQNTGLMFHMRTHTGYKPHVCKYCGRGFTSNSNCINHERTHTGDRPFVCHFCSAAFAKSCTLKAHITTHTGEANYHCKTCGKSFRRLKYLKEHKFTHTGEKPYVCKICGTAYSHSGSLFVHEKKCKAQYSSFQSVSSENVQNFCRSQMSITSAPLISSLINTLPPSSHHHITDVVNGSLEVEINRNYSESVQRIGAHSATTTTAVITNEELNVHPVADVSDDINSSVRNYTIIGQIFHQ